MPLLSLLAAGHDHSGKGGQLSIALWAGIVVLTVIVVVGLLVVARLMAGWGAARSRPCPGCGRFFNPEAEKTCPFCGASDASAGGADQED